MQHCVCLLSHYCYTCNIKCISFTLFKCHHFDYVEICNNSTSTYFMLTLSCDDSSLLTLFARGVSDSDRTDWARRGLHMLWILHDWVAAPPDILQTEARNMYGCGRGWRFSPQIYLWSCLTHHRCMPDILSCNSYIIYRVFNSNTYSYDCPAQPNHTHCNSYLIRLTVISNFTQYPSRLASKFPNKSMAKLQTYPNTQWRSMYWCNKWNLFTEQFNSAKLERYYSECIEYCSPETLL